MKITLHVGMGKTGTTSIQTFLEKNRQKLLDNKVFYTKNLDNIGIGGFSTDFADKIENLDEVIVHLNQFLKKEGIEHFIWSLESLFTSKKETIKRIKNGLSYSSIEIIIFVRRQDHWFESAFYQWGWKHKTYTGTYLIEFDEFFRTKIQLGNYYNWIRNWDDLFGKENIKIQPLEKEQIPNGLIDCFCSLAQLDTTKLDTEEIVEYQNMGHYFNQMIGIHNATNEEMIYNGRLIRMFEEVSKLSVQNKKYADCQLISPQKRIEIIERFEKGNNEIAKHYLGRENGILFYEKPPAIDDEWKEYEPLDLNNSLPILIDLLLKQNNEIEGLKRRIRNQEERVNYLINNQEGLT
jgi:hypothetical protein